MLCKIPKAGLQHLCQSTKCFMMFYAPPGECEGQPGGNMSVCTVQWDWGLKNLQRLQELFQFYAKLTLDSREGRTMLTYMQLGSTRSTPACKGIPLLTVLFDVWHQIPLSVVFSCNMWIFRPLKKGIVMARHGKTIWFQFDTYWVCSSFPKPLWLGTRPPPVYLRMATTTYEQHPLFYIQAWQKDDESTIWNRQNRIEPYRSRWSAKSLAWKLSAQGLESVTATSQLSSRGKHRREQLHPIFGAIHWGSFCLRWHQNVGPGIAVGRKDVWRFWRLRKLCNKCF